MFVKFSRIVAVLLIVGVPFACVTPAVSKSRSKGETLSTADQEKDCLKYYESSLNNPNQFVGYGTASSAEGALDLARVDLAKQIRTKVSSISSTHESNTNVTTDSVNSSTVDELLVGLRVVRRCHGKDHEAVVSLLKPTLIGSLEQRLTVKLRDAESLQGRLQAAKDESDRVREALASRQFIASAEDPVSSDLEVCHTFGGCQEMSRAPIQNLKKSLLEHGKGLRFGLVAQDEDAKQVASAVVRMLGSEGLDVRSGPPEDSRRAILSCDRKVFPKTGSNQFVELACQVNGVVDGDQVFVREYSAKGLGANESEATQMARSSLRKI